MYCYWIINEVISLSKLRLFNFALNLFTDVDCLTSKGKLTTAHLRFDYGSFYKIQCGVGNSELAFQREVRYAGAVLF